MRKRRSEDLVEIFNDNNADLGSLVLLCDKMAQYEKYDEHYVMNEDFETYRDAIAYLAMELCGYIFDPVSRRYVESIR